ncbi:hypothetical protein TWF718_004146 [Orbilia javanica]|uniref:Peptidase metallopeptidase domain-containing protein n=1 Tax=Orbilia javanica TaxID=47235 RepID=A0AAN8RQ36_9PEZI
MPPPSTVEAVAQEAGLAIKSIMTHLACFGCLPSDSEIEKLGPPGPFHSYAILSIGLIKFQKQMELPATGIFDIETANRLNRPHCHHSSGRGIDLRNILEIKEHYSQERKKKITYCFSVYTHQLSVHVVREIFKGAFKMWEDLTELPINFVEVAPHLGKGNIRITWANGGRHGTDGPVFVAYPPRSDYLNENTPIEIYFDEMKKWTVDKLRSAITHQVGHLFGLLHTKDRGKIMWPGYTTEESDSEDIAALSHTLESSAIITSQAGETNVAKLRPREDRSRRLWVGISGQGEMSRIIAGPGGMLYSLDWAGNISRFNPSTQQSPYLIPFRSTELSMRTVQIVASSEYLYGLTEDGSVWRCRHDGEEWLCIDKEQGTTVIAAFHGSAKICKYTKDGEIHVFREPESSEIGSWDNLGCPIPAPPPNPTEIKLTVTDCEVYFDWGNLIRRGLSAPKRRAALGIVDTDAWENVDTVSTSRIINGNGSIYRQEIDNPEKVAKLIPEADLQWVDVEIKLPSNESYILGEFFASGTHRYITYKTRQPGYLERPGVWYKRMPSGDNATSHQEWEDLDRPKSISQLAATGDYLYYLDGLGNIYTMFMD